MKSRADESARREARALRAAGMVPLLRTAEVSDRDPDAEPQYTCARVHALLSVAGRLDLVKEARTRIGAGDPEPVLWAPAWAAELAEANALSLVSGPAAELVDRAEADPELRARTSAALSELRDALRAAALLGGPEAARKLREALRRG